jgi:hypothetical protein
MAIPSLCTISAELCKIVGRILTPSFTFQKRKEEKGDGESKGERRGWREEEN